MTKSTKMALFAELRLTKHEIDLQLEEARETAKEMRILPQKLRDHRGGFVMGPLLSAKASVMTAIVALETAGN